MIAEILLRLVKEEQTWLNQGAVCFVQDANGEIATGAAVASRRTETHSTVNARWLYAARKRGMSIAVSVPIFHASC